VGRSPSELGAGRDVLALLRKAERSSDVPPGPSGPNSVPRQPVRARPTFLPASRLY